MYVVYTGKLKKKTTKKPTKKQKNKPGLCLFVFLYLVIFIIFHRISKMINDTPLKFLELVV